MKRWSGLSLVLLGLMGCSGVVETGREAAGVTATGAAVAPQRVRMQRASLADAPDRGALVAYGAAVSAARQEGAQTWYPAAISEAHAFQAIASGRMHIPTPDGKQVSLRYLRHVEQLDGNWTWIGQVEGGNPDQKAIITFGPQAVFGSIPQDGAPALQLQTRQGQVFVVMSDPTRMATARTPDDSRLPAVTTGMPDKAALQLSERHAPVQAYAAGATARPAPNSQNTVDAVVGYSAGLATQLGGASAATTRMAFLVEYANQTLDNSQVPGHLRLVGTVQVNYADSGDNDDALDALTKATDPAMDPLRQLRDTKGADIALLARKLEQTQGGCGVAWLLGGGQREITQWDADWAYGVVGDGSYSKDGKTWYCEDSTLGHETGHLLGSAHDRANASGSGRYLYSYGYNANGVCDIMAYCNSGNSEYQVFSNPRITLCGGQACGVENSEDNARSISQTLPIIATFRATVVPHEPQSAVRNDFNGDGKSDVFWRNLSDGRNIVWWAADFANQFNPGSVITQSWSVVGAGDYDGDGKSDLFWRNAADGQNIVWPSADGSQKRSLTTITGLDWKVVASGDFDGDGRGDVFWRHATNGQNAIWWSGDYAARTMEQQVSTAWIVAGAGDINGDGKDDVVWRNTATGANIVWWSGKYAGFTNLTSVLTQAWEIVAVDDFDGNGKADLFWRQRTTGESILWWNGDYANQVRELTVSTAWKVVASGDYNGDGKADLLWRNGVTGANIVWDSGRFANARNLTGVTNTAWVVQR